LSYGKGGDFGHLFGLAFDFSFVPILLVSSPSQRIDPHQAIPRRNRYCTVNGNSVIVPRSGINVSNGKYGEGVGVGDPPRLPKKNQKADPSPLKGFGMTAVRFFSATRLAAEGVLLEMRAANSNRYDYD
jgi:hypothetical protein